MTHSVTDYEAAYRELRLRLTDLLHERPGDELEQVTPTCPEWRVRDLPAHLGGVCDDIAHGNMDGVATDAWTRAQVDKRRDWPFEQVLTDWSEHAAVVESMMNDIGQPMGQLVFDAWTHEQDARTALGVPCDRESAAVDVAFGWWVATAQQFVGAGPDAGPTEAFRLVCETGEFDFGPGTPTQTLRASRFEFLRAITGRRSSAQVLAFAWDGNTPLDELVFTNELFSPATRDIVE
jgi:uncharacterized protein (TIGR03083 family)